MAPDRRLVFKSKGFEIHFALPRKSRRVHEFIADGKATPTRMYCSASPKLWNHPPLQHRRRRRAWGVVRPSPAIVRTDGRRGAGLDAACPAGATRVRPGAALSCRWSCGAWPCPDWAESPEICVRFKQIFCSDISEFESFQPSQPVQLAPPFAEGVGVRWMRPECFVEDAPARAASSRARARRCRAASGNRVQVRALRS